MKVLYFDTETTGRDAKKNDIIQFSGQIEIDGVVKESFDFRIRAHDMNAIEPEAIAVHGISVAQIEAYEHPRDAYARIIRLFSKYINKYNKADKFYPAGYNVKFDLDFLQEFFKKCGDQWGTGTWQNWKAIDPLPVLQFMDSQQMISLPNYKLSTVCEHFGIAIKAHDAESDIAATKAVIEKVRSFITYKHEPAPVVAAQPLQIVLSVKNQQGDIPF